MLQHIFRMWLYPCAAAVVSNNLSHCFQLGFFKDGETVDAGTTFRTPGNATVNLMAKWQILPQFTCAVCVCPNIS